MQREQKEWKEDHTVKEEGMRTENKEKKKTKKTKKRKKTTQFCVQ